MCLGLKGQWGFSGKLVDRGLVGKGQWGFSGSLFGRLLVSKGPFFFRNLYARVPIHESEHRWVCKRKKWRLVVGLAVLDRMTAVLPRERRRFFVPTICTR